MIFFFYETRYCLVVNLNLSGLKFNEVIVNILSLCNYILTILSRASGVCSHVQIE